MGFKDIKYNISVCKITKICKYEVFFNETIYAIFIKAWGSRISNTTLAFAKLQKYANMKFFLMKQYMLYL